MINLQDVFEETKKANLPLQQGRTLVFGRGKKDADILFIGEAPGKDEDEQGLPFVGRGGKLLQKNIEKANINSYYIANILKYRPPKNRNPKKEEIRKHTPYLLKQINAIQPKIICTLGNYSTKYVLAGFQTKNMNKQQNISKVRGKKHILNHNQSRYIIFPIYHPAATLYNPDLRPVFEKDIRKIKNLIKK